MNYIMLGIGMILIGLVSAIYSLYPILQFKNSRNWPITAGIVSNITNTGMLFRLRRIVYFTYQIDSKSYKSSQMMPRDSLVNGLASGNPIQIRYCNDKPGSAIIDHPQTGGYVCLACWNSLWIIFGLCLLFK